VSDTELLPKSKLEPVRRLEVFTGAGRRRTWTAEQKAQILAESYESGEKVSAVARRHGLTPQQLFGWRRDARRAVTRRPQARERLSLVRQLEGRRLRRAGFRVADVAKRWTMPMSDIEDYASALCAWPIASRTAVGSATNGGCFGIPVPTIAAGWALIAASCARSAFRQIRHPDGPRMRQRES